MEKEKLSRVQPSVFLGYQPAPKGKEPTKEELALIKDHVENWNRPAHLSDAAMRGDLAKGCQYIKENMLGERSIEELLSKLK
jgi:hypothetical protein